MAKLKPNEAATLLNVSVKTLQRWDRQGVLNAYRTPTDRRYYTEEQIQQFNDGNMKNKDINDQIIDRGFRLVWKEDIKNDCFVSLDNGIAKVFLVDKNDPDYNEFDVLYDQIFTASKLEYSISGLKISNSLIYNVVLDYIISEFENGNKDAGDLMYPLLDEHKKSLKNHNDESQLHKLVKKYINEILFTEDK